MLDFKNTIRNYFRNKSEIVAVYLFGSHARGKARPLSDVDIAIVMQQPHAACAQLRRIEYMTELGRLLKKDIHAVIMNTAGEELLRQIFSTGTCLLSNDAAATAHFTTAAFVRIAAFALYQQQMSAGFIHALKKEACVG